MTPFDARTATIAAATLAAFAILNSNGFGLPFLFAAVTAPLAALFVFRHLRRYNLLKIAVANMWQGLAVYSANGELVLHNGRFCAMLGLSPLDVRQATTHRDIIDLSFRTGNYEGRSADQVWREDTAFIARRQPALAYIDLPGDRTVAESHEPTPDGGWIRTYADVTGRRQIEARIVHMAHRPAARPDRPSHAPTCRSPT